MNIISYSDSDGNSLNGFSQWDYNQSIIVRLDDISIIPLFHFCNRRRKSAFVVKPTIVNSDLVVSIPNILLQEAETILIYVYLDDTDGGSKTIYTIRIPVSPRAKPDDYEYVENIEYISWVKIEQEAYELLDELRSSNYITGMIGDVEPENRNTFWFDTSVYMA